MADLGLLETRGGRATRGAGCLFFFFVVGFLCVCVCVSVNVVNIKRAQCCCQDRKVESHQASLLCRCSLALWDAISLSL